jgi:DNA-binding protein HU-beta
MTSRVVPGIDVTMARLERVRRLNNVDFPTLGRPMRTTEGRECEAKFGSVDRLSDYFYSIYSVCLRGIPPMIKVDIVNEVSKIADITKVKAEVAVDAVFDAMRLSMQRGDRIELRGFGVFQVKPRKRGIGRNPRTGKEVRIPPGRTIRFKPGKDLQNIG